MPSNITKQASGYSTSTESKRSQLEKQGRTFRQFPGLLIYRSKHGNENNLNCAASDKNGKKIACRHLSGYLFFHHSHLKDYHESYKSLENIKSIKYLYNNEYDENNPELTCHYYNTFPVQFLGQALSNIASDLIVNKEKARMFFSKNHLMMISIIKKKLSTDKHHYIIKFYDPNKTNSHIRIICDNLDSMSKLQVEQILGEDRTTAYFKESRIVSLLGEPDSSNKALMTVMFHYTLNDKQVMYAHERFRLSRILLNGIKYACHQSLKQYVDEILKSELSECNKTRLLSVKTRYGTPGLQLVSDTKKDGPKTLKLYMEMVVGSTLGYNKKILLLNAKDDIGYSALQAALIDEKTQVLKMYIEVILKSDLKINEKMALLSPIDGYGMNVLEMARENHYAEAIKVYIELISRSLLDEESKNTLLNGEDVSQTSSHPLTK